MAYFSVDIPGVGEVSVKGNFATEDTLKHLATVMAKKFKLDMDQLQESAEDTAEAFDDAGDILDDFNATLQRTDDNGNKLAKSLHTVNSGFNIFKNSLESSIDGSFSLSNAFRTAGDMIGDAVGGLASLLGPAGAAIGKFAGNALTFATGLLATGLGMVEGLSDLNQRLFQGGFLIQGGFDAMVQASADAKVPLQEFTAAVTKNAETLRYLEGGLTGGVKQITRALGQIEPKTRRTFFALGYTTEDIVGAMSEYAAQARRAGQDLSTDQLAKGTEDYLKNLAELSKLTGKTVDELRAERESRQIETAWRAFYESVPEKSRAALNQWMDGLTPTQQEFAKARLMSVQLLDPAKAYMQQSMTGFNAEVDLYKRKVFSGLATVEDSNESLNRMRIEANNASKRVLREVGQSGEFMAQMQQVGSSIFSDIVDTANQLELETDKAKEAASNTRTAIEDLGKFAKSIGNLELTTQNAASAMQTLSLSILDQGTWMFDMISKGSYDLVEKSREVFDSLEKLSDKGIPESVKEGIKERLNSLLPEFRNPSVYDATRTWSEFFDEWGAYLLGGDFASDLGSAFKSAIENMFSFWKNVVMFSPAYYLGKKMFGSEDDPAGPSMPLDSYGPEYGNTSVPRGINDTQDHTQYIPNSAIDELTIKRAVLEAPATQELQKQSSANFDTKPIVDGLRNLQDEIRKNTGVGIALNEKMDNLTRVTRNNSIAAA